MHAERTYLGTQLALILHRRKWTQARLSELSGISQPAISQIISKLKRADPASLDRLCNCWETPQTNVVVLIAHLRDEIKRAGHDPINAIEMAPRNGARPTTVNESRYDELRDYLDDPGVSDLIADLVTLLRRARAAGTGSESQRAAEPPSAYPNAGSAPGDKRP